MADRVHFHLFTYGTLKQGSVRHSSAEVLAGAELLGPGTVSGTLYDAGAFPALLLGGDSLVHGQVWRCPASLLTTLDAYEGVDQGLFRRVAVEVDGVVCWIYVAGPRLGPRLLPEARIETGTWNR